MNDVISLRYGRKELVESYTDLSVPAFIEHKYSAKDNFKSLRWMIDRKVDLRDFRLKVDGVCDRGRVLQRILLMSEKAEIATYFLTKCEVKNTEVTDKKVTDKFGNDSSTLIMASGLGYTDVVRALLNRGANVDHANAIGDTVLLGASEKGHLDTVLLLVDREAAVDHANNDGGTALI